MMKVRAAGVLALALASIASPAGGQAEVGRHHWIALVDVSASFEQRDEAQSGELGRDEYRLRDETLSLLQVLLAARGVKELGRRADTLSVYVFGRGVERIQELTSQPLTWQDVHSPEWWREHLPTGLSARTNYLQALNAAVADFKDDPPGTERHVILISDGELDVGEDNRQPGTPPGIEELRVYRDLLRRDTDPFNWLASNEIQVHTLAIDPEVAAFNDSRRQEQIRRELERFQAIAPFPLEQALGLIESRGSRVDESGQLFDNEGPYVLAALALELNGRPRSVRYDNVLSVLWQVLFPEHSNRRFVPFGAHEVLIFAPLQAPVQFVIEEGGRRSTVTLTYDPQRDTYHIEPERAWEGLEVQHHETDQWVTWWIHHPNLAEVDPGYLLDDRLSLVAAINADLLWQPGAPDAEELGDQPVDLIADLVWWPYPERPSREEWRNHLRGQELSATGELILPDGSRQPLELAVEVSDEGDRLARIRGSAPVREEGTYQATAVLTIGADEESPQIKLEPVQFDVLFESPLSTEDRYLLRLRRWGEDGETAELIDFPRSRAGGSDPLKMSLDPQEPIPLSFEWWGLPDEDCLGLQRLSLLLPQFEREFQASENVLGENESEVQGDRRLCYRTPTFRVDATLWERPLEVEARDGFVDPLIWRWQIDLPMSDWARFWTGLGVFVLLVALLVVIVLWRRIATHVRLVGASFPLAVDTDGGSVAWRPWRPRRFVVTANGSHAEAKLSFLDPRGSDNTLIIEQSKRSEVTATARRGGVWRMIVTNADGTPRSEDSQPVGRGGIRRLLLDLQRGQHLRFENGGASVTLRHQAR